MARTNYQHGKRLRELAKKQKREEKEKRRKERKEGGGVEGVAEDGTPEEGGLESPAEGDVEGDTPSADSRVVPPSPV